MTDNSASLESLIKPTGVSMHDVQDPDTARIVINHNTVLDSHLLPGLKADVEETEDGIRAKIILEQGTVIEKQVHLCFGMLPEEGVQKIDLDIEIQDNALVTFLAHCVFPNAVDVQHLMTANIRLGENASYSYLERHVHSDKAGIKVVPEAKVEIGKGSRFKSEFELLRGRVGLIDIDYEATCHENSVLEMTSRINGAGDDHIKIRETGHLVGAYAKGVLTSRIAVRDKAKADVYNKLTASAPHARGHVDCQEIVQDNGVATAIPIVEVNHPKAHITHEAAIGSVDNKQLETLMSRGLSEDDAVELIIEGLLS